MTAIIKRRRAKTAETVPTNNVDDNTDQPAVKNIIEPTTSVDELAEVSEAGPANQAIDDDTTPTTSASTAAPTTADSAEAFIERRLDLASRENVAREEMLTRLCQQLGNGELQPHTLNLTRAQRAIFADMGCENVFDIIRKIGEYRATLALRLRVGPPEILTAAKSKLAECDAALTAARADALDLDDVEPGPGSPLARQIARLQTRLAGLEAARDAAAKEVARTEADREQLFARAPKWLRDEVLAEVAAVRVGHPTQVAENALKNQLQEVSKAVELFSIESWVDPDRLAKFGGNPFINRKVEMEPSYSLNDFRYVYAARMYRPEIVNEGNGHTPSIDRRDLVAFMTWLKTVEHPRLEAELARVKAEWAAIEEQIKAPLIHWAATGEFA